MTGLAFDFSHLVDRPTKLTVVRDSMARALRDALERPGARAHARRIVKERRKYAGDPWAYIADILGLTLTEQQEAVLDLIERESRVLVPAANNVGKTFLLGAYGVYTMDAVAALPDAESGAEEQGARVLLPGPDGNTVFETVYSEMLTHATRAEVRGHLMPGERSDRSVHWRVRAKWNVEPLTPARRVTQRVAHAASGRHHRNLLALIEEGQGVEEPLWRAAEGMASSEKNKIVSSFNPTEPIGPAFQRARNGVYRVFHMSAFDHPNVRSRRSEIPDAIDARVIDSRVRADCRERGPYPATRAEPEHGDFVYALPKRGAIEKGPRKDGHLGHAAAPLRVFRPNGTFTAQVLGQWPAASESGLFNAGDWDQAVERWKAAREPASAPDRVGVDPAREGNDDTCAAPSWGESAEALLRSYADTQTLGDEAVARFRSSHRLRIGEISVLPKGDGVDVARRLDNMFPDSPFNVDEGGVGSSPHDHLFRILERDSTNISFAASPLPRVPDEPWSDNMRTQLYIRFAMLVVRGLVDVPDDLQLREEMLAHWAIPTSRTAEVYNAKKGRREKIRVPSNALPDKAEIKKLIGRSPDRADATVLAAFHEAVIKRRTSSVPLSTSYASV